MFLKVTRYLVKNKSTLRNLRNLITALLIAVTFLQFGVVSSMPVLKGMLLTSGRLFPDFQKAEVSQI